MPLADDQQIQSQYKSACITSSVSAWLAVIAIISYVTYLPSDFQSVSVLDKINPNKDPLQSLVRLPSIGPARAELIIEYRSGGDFYASPSDLENIRGIGPKTVDKIGPWLYFKDSEDN